MTEARARILYIDDDDGLRRLVSRSLARRGYDVIVAASGPDGLALAQAERFDLIAIDHYMPGQDGLATLKQLGTLPDLPPVVYVTGSDESRVAVAALKAGAADYVVKSVGEDFFDLLGRAFDQALGQLALRRAKDAAEADLRESNTRLEALLKEVNHRVANSLQIVAAMVHLQSQTLPSGDAKVALEDTRRIDAIGKVHRSLYASGDAERVDMAEYLAALVAELKGTWSTPGAARELLLASDPIRLPSDKAVSLGVIVNELVSNACKYAYPPDAPGEIRIALRKDGSDHFLLRVEDDGCGLPEDGAAAARGTGLGTKLIDAMARSLQTSLEFDPRRPGVTATLRAACA